LSTVDDFIKLKDKYTIIGVDNIPGAIPINNYQYKPNSLFVFGTENDGLTPIMRSLCQEIIEITGYGSVRSLNCGIASGIILYDVVRKFNV